MTVNNHGIEEFLEEQRTELEGWRRSLHRYPEPGWTEYRTSYLLAEELNGLGFELHVGKAALESSERIGVPDRDTLSRHEQEASEAGVLKSWIEQVQGGHTGLVARWDTGNPGPHTALRFDIDALPIQESDSENHLPASEGFRSERAGFMHACGHDGHAAIGVGVARLIQRFANNLSGRFTLLFQPAEEGVRGAGSMVAKGWLENVDYFLCGHLGVNLPELGAVAATTAGFLSTTKMDVEFFGRSAHAGGEPEEGKNALLAAAAAAVHLQGIPRHSAGATRVNVGKLEAGTNRNIVPDHAKLELETRGDSGKLNSYMEGEARRIIEASAQLQGVEACIEVVGKATGAACDEEFVGLLEEACSGTRFVEQIVTEARLGGSEDATLMMERVRQVGGKSTYMLFGTPTAGGHHNPSFDFQEEALTVAVEALGRTVGLIAGPR